MKPQPGQHVKCIFKNGTIVEGIVEEWDIEVHLLSLTDKSLMIICHPSEDLMMIKIMPDLAEDIVEGPAQEKVEIPIQDQIRTKIREVIVPNENSELQKSSIAELKRLAVEQEKQIIAKKIKEHYPSAYVPHKPNYGSQMDLSVHGSKRRN
jgi:hypothetical protein